MKVRLVVYALPLLACLAALAWSRPADAFCGFYVSGADASLTDDATLVVLMRDGERTVLSMQNTYAGPPQDFALVVPVPVVLHEANVKVLPPEVFKKVDQLTAPRLVEYWEQDPCRSAGHVRHGAHVGGGSRGRARGGGPVGPAAPREDRGALRRRRVRRGGPVGAGLDGPRRAGCTTITTRSPTGAEPYLRPYVQMGMKFFVAKVNVAKVKFERVGQRPRARRAVAAALPLRRRRLLPARAAGPHQLRRQAGPRRGRPGPRGQRYEVANYDNVAIPTNLDVADAVRAAVRRVLRLALRPRRGEAPARRRDRVLVGRRPAAIPAPPRRSRTQELATLGRRRAARTMAPGGGSFVITRLHARYAQGHLGDDLHFRPAAAIVGGREGQGTQAQAEHSTNNFQARYVIRHKWSGGRRVRQPAASAMWGGPPDGQRRRCTSPALGLAFAARDVGRGARW